MPNAVLTLHPAFTVGPVRRRTFGSFVEHMGRCVYEGIYQPDHPSADEDGFRTDVLEMVRELGISTVRYPGGNFVSGYRWEDGVGPCEERPRRVEMAWHSVETNEFGLDEFMRWTKKAGVEPMMAVNLGTRGVQEACDLLEYANLRSGTHFADARIANGSAEPHNIRMWCLGNEMDGPWQIGHKTPEEYARLAAETGRAMRMIDPTLELVACGSSGPEIDTFGTWERAVLTEAYDQVDYISLHAYYQERDGDLGSFLASGVHMDRFIADVVAHCDHVRSVRRKEKRIMLSFDEWNVWYQTRFDTSGPPSDWVTAPPIAEDDYTVADAVVVGGLLISLLRNSDRVTAASQAQLVNVLGLIRTEPGEGPAWRQTIFHPFALTSAHARGQVLDVGIDAPRYDTVKYGEVPLVDAVATHDPETGALAVFAVNRDTERPVTLDLDLRAFEGSLGEGRLRVLHGDGDPHVVNDARDPERVLPAEGPAVRPVDGRAGVTLPPVSWSVLTFPGR
ncbi:arabinosylfuranosidase ArfA [Streptomyces triticirhizae]|uniref:non-reducing end alpha-L-arabinofuranosidase n=1 Tax=Streptomyces triticirhizae TaxID=2483353 RepID=A0A3M2LYF8_9ACTN|nr:alpha-N-arabinofuranosidase [Streptomyces triticirhizae]RMI41950.1 alpha-N-arabinofuranosidase [Streptomyces triticirhizae]